MPSPHPPYAITDRGDLEWDDPEIERATPVRIVRGFGYYHGPGRDSMPRDVTPQTAYNADIRYFSKPDAKVARIDIRVYGTPDDFVKSGMEVFHPDGNEYVIVDTKACPRGASATEVRTVAVRADVYDEAVEDLGCAMDWERQ